MLIKPVGYLLSALLLTACQTSLKVTEPNSSKPTLTVIPDNYSSIAQSDIVGVYKGTLPCADCYGIETKLILNDDNTFVYDMLYLNKQDEHFIDKGNYTVKNNIITIYEDSRAVRFLINEGVLTYLGKDLQPITSPLAPYYQLNKQQTFNYAGKYETFFETQDDYTQTLSITPTGEKYNVSFSASKVNGKENCRFSGQAWLENNILWMNISKDSNKEILMYIAPSHDNLGLEVFTDKFEDRFQMMFYCKGGGSLAGKYIKNTIKTDSIGVFDASTTIEDVLHTLPATQIHKKIGHGEFLDDLYDDLNRPDYIGEWIA